MRILYLLLATVLTLSSFSADNKDFEEKVRDAVNRQMKIYPKSTLKDLYKNFFQDRFGPGHIIADTAAARRYLLNELNSYSVSSGELAEPTGWEQNFYRVNLSVLKDEIIPLDRFLDAFIRSVNEIKPITVEEWQKEWSQIEAVIRSMNLSLPNYDNDYNEIKNRLEEGNYVGHHSKEFNESYAPHYRIISKEIFEKELLPLIDHTYNKIK
ncbi:MAG: hypothetical protein LBQ22_03575 [Bacteroidales bacterium]|jgi:hypothetical protein|nr:hypothetical protein [Bacteroidales bacterium]